MADLPFKMDLTAWVASLDEDGLEFFEERAAILEHEGGLPRVEAEAMAYGLTLAYLQRREARHVRD
jgi:hypothetical protein